VTILAFDFTSAHGGLAIRRDSQTVLEQSLYSPDGFAHLVFGAVDDILRRAGVRLAEIDCFAAASGPGSFTGVRVGLAAVKGLAEACGKRAMGVSNLRAVASFGGSPLRAVILDARRGDVFTAVYDAGLNLVIPETVGPLRAFLKELSREPDEVITQGTDWLRSGLAGTPWANMSVIEAPQSLASAVAECAYWDWQGGATGDPAALDANYVRRSDAELFWKDA